MARGRLLWWWPTLALVELALGFIGFGEILKNPELVDIPAFTGLLVQRGVPLAALAWLCLILPSMMAMGAAVWIYAGARRDSYPLWFGLGFVALFLFQGGAGVGLAEAWKGIGSLFDGLLLVGGLSVFLLFPNGQWWPRWSRLVYPVLCIPLLADISLTQDLRALLAEPGASLGWSRLPGAASVLALFALVVIAQVFRFVWHSSAVERLQTKWVLFTYFFWSIPVVGAIMLTLAGRGQSWLGLLVGVATWFSYLIPIACAVAVTKHRLYDLDRVVSRTVTYSLVAGVVALLYVGGVALARYLFPLAGSLGVAASTLAAVAVISPLYRRIRDAIDRRFNRTRYDAQVESAAFGNRLQSALDLDQLVSDLAEVLQKTVQPATTAIWMKAIRSSALEVPFPIAQGDRPP